MKTYSRFEDYLQDKYYNEIFYAIRNYVYENGQDLRLYSFLVTDAEYYKLDDIHVKGVRFNLDQTRDNNLLFTVSVEANVIISGHGQRDYEEDNQAPWFSVSLSGVLCDGLKNVHVLGVEEYTKSKYNAETALSHYLVPYLYAKNLDKEAENFLKRHYPEALLKPTKLSMDHLLKNMGLVERYAPLNDKVFGCTYFRDAQVSVCDKSGGDIKEEQISAGTVLVNPNICFMRNIGSENNTIVHECVHWDRHRRFFEIQKILNKDIKAIKCETVKDYNDKDNELVNTLKWMEWQANALAPRILVPEKTAKDKLYSLLEELRKAFPDKRPAARMELAILNLSEFYGVSVISAKMRAIEMGFDDAEGTSVFVNGRYYPAYSFKRGTLKKDQTFVIDEKNAIFECAVDQSLRSMVETGAFIYANGTFAINDPEYVTRSEVGAPILTDYALEHMDECCLVFDRKLRVSREYDDSFYRMCFLCSNINSATFVEASYNPKYKDNQNKTERAHEIMKSRDAVKTITENLQEVPSGFGPTLSFHMKRKNITIEELAERSRLSSRVIGDYRNKKNIRDSITLQSVIALCIGLNLQGYYSEDLIDKAGFRLGMTEEQLLYHYLIYNHSDENIDTWNQIISDMGLSRKIP